MQAFKFAVYVGVPIALTAFVVYNPDNLQALIAKVTPLSAGPWRPDPPPSLRSRPPC